MSKPFVKNTIVPELKEICSAENLDINTSQGIGTAFQMWVRNLLLKDNQSIDKDEIDDTFFLAKDEGVDMILYAHDSQLCYVVQTKYKNPDSYVKRDDIMGFFSLHKSIMRRGYFDKPGMSNLSIEALSEYKQRIKDGWGAKWIFATTGKLPVEFEAQQQDDNIEYLVYDSTRMKDVLKEANSQESAIPDKVDFPIPNDSYVELFEPRHTLIAIIKGNELRNIYKKHKERILAINIRSFMGSNTVNKDIQYTAQESPENFLYFNNGISAICTKFEVKINGPHVHVYTEKFQVINGGQTIGSLAKATPDDHVRVLLKLTKGKSVSTEKGFNEEVIRYNNTQNSIKNSDFRANDDVQNDIFNKFKDLGLVDVLDKRIAYLPKRGKNAPATHRKINLESLARIIYAYKENPCVSVEKPKELWDIDKKYKDVFGEANDIWSTDYFHECVLSLAFYVAIEDKIKKLKKYANEIEEPEKFNHLGRLKYHILGLAKVYMEHHNLPITIWKIEKDFKEHFTEFWKTQSSVTHQIKSEADQKKDARGSLSNIIRNNDRWVSLRDDYNTLLIMQQDV